MSDSDLEILEEGYYVHHDHDHDPDPDSEHLIDLDDPNAVSEFLAAEHASNRAFEAGRIEARRRQQQGRSDRRDRRRSFRHSPIRRPPPRDPPPQREVIDLTDEPDSPVRAPAQPALTLPSLQSMIGFDRHLHDQPIRHPRGDAAPTHHRNRRSPSAAHASSSGRHPRRAMSSFGRTPSLSRSDASISVASENRPPQENVIDLTVDDDPPPEGSFAPRSRRRRFAAPLFEPLPAPRPLLPPLDGLARQVRATPLSPPPPPPPPRGRGIHIRPIAGPSAEPWPAIERMGHIIHHVQGMLGFGGGNNAVELNYHANGMNHLNMMGHLVGREAPAPAAAAPKQGYVPPPPAPEGFTNNTGEDVVAVCPACDQELEYDQDEVAPPTPSGKKPRSKKDRAEHHFMAVKACGHVFCFKCYDKRKEMSKKGNGFRPGRKSAQVLCAVEHCQSEVGAKTAWVGIFT